MENVLFYKYVNIDSPKQLKTDLLEFCSNEGLKGKILIAKEGINGNLTGTEEQTNNFIKYFTSDPRFSDIEFKIAQTNKHNFKRTLVKIREEIISTRFGADIKYKAPYIEPIELKKLLDNNEDIVIIDTRNDYEYEVGHFKGAIELPIKTFQDFPQGVKTIEKYKDKKVITYCTGGVRCEKASAYLRQQGFKEVYQLHGGIIRYGEIVGADHWEGKCFVFDERGAIDLGKKERKMPIVANIDHLKTN